MRVYLNREPVKGPWGGGTKLVGALVDRLKIDGHDIIHVPEQADVYVCFDPRPDQYGMDASHILSACHAANGRFVCRIGDVGTHGKPELTRLWTGVIAHAHDVVFPSVWARDYLVQYAHDCLPQLLYAVEDRCSKSHIVPNGALRIFGQNRRDVRPYDGKVRVVTHHWSDNPLKGFDVYTAFDALDEFEFTYIGRKPAGVEFKRHIQPMSAEQLAVELPKYDVYLTASKWEAGANHVLEAMAAGLFVAYGSEGGSIPEYCDDWGKRYNHGCAIEDVARVVRECYEDSEYDTPDYTRTTEDDVVDEYMEVILR